MPGDLRDGAWVVVDAWEAGSQIEAAVLRGAGPVGGDRLAQDLGLRATLIARQRGQALGLLVIEVDTRLAHAHSVGHDVGRNQPVIAQTAAAARLNRFAKWRELGVAQTVHSSSCCWISREGNGAWCCYQSGTIMG